MVVAHVNGAGFNSAIIVEFNTGICCLADCRFISN
jgi:hypothetical protein